MMLDGVIREVLAVEGPAAFVTNGTEAAHLVATWQSYIEILDEATAVFPAGGYRVTEANLLRDSSLQMVIGSRLGKRAVGFRLRGTAVVESGTAVHERLKARFPWCRAAVVFTVSEVEQILGS